MILVVLDVLCFKCIKKNALLFAVIFCLFLSSLSLLLYDSFHSIPSTTAVTTMPVTYCKSWDSPGCCSFLFLKHEDLYFMVSSQLLALVIMIYMGVGAGGEKCRKHNIPFPNLVVHQQRVYEGVWYPRRDRQADRQTDRQTMFLTVYVAGYYYSTITVL